MKIGIVGEGQLAWLLGRAAKAMGHEACALGPQEEASANGSCGRIVAPYDDSTALRALSAWADVVTFEFEHLPFEVIAETMGASLYRPGLGALRAGRDRLLEREVFLRYGIPVADHVVVTEQEHLVSGCERLGGEAILKTARGGYDGKGQARGRTAQDFLPAFETWGRPPCLLEALVPLRREVSIIAARGVAGEMSFHSPTQNWHDDGILRVSLAPAPSLTPADAAELFGTVRRLAEGLNYVGTLAVEFFETDAGFVANEMAPRVHNSGHWTLDGGGDSQFDQHLRAVAGETLEPCQRSAAVVMLNLIGAMPDGLEQFAAAKDVMIYDYRKDPRQGRKVGHINVTADNIANVLSRASVVAESLGLWWPAGDMAQGEDSASEK